MKVLSLLALLLLGGLASESALAWGHHHGGVRFGVFVGPPLFGPWWWYPPPARPYYYDPPPVVYRQPVVVAAPPPPPVVESAPIYSAPAAPAGNGVIELGPAPGATPAPSQRSVPVQPQANAMPPQNQPQTLANQSQPNHGQVYVYPRQGQNAQQQAQDEADCNRWASTQMGSGFNANEAAAHFQRALSACLDAHGYSVR
jgi:hypothetical protein